MRIPLLICFHLFLTLKTFCQPEVEKFNQLYYESLEKTVSLYIAKGVINKAEYFGKADYAADYFSLLNQYGEKSATTGFLFYFYSNDRLHIFLLEHDKLSSVSKAVSKDSLLNAEIALRTALNVDKMAQSGLPVKRGNQPLSTSSPGKISIRKAISIAGDLLCPKPIADKISSLEHIMILPELNIGRFPFYILQPFGNDQYLIDKISIAFIPRLVNPSQGVISNVTIGKPFTHSFSSPLIVGNPQYAVGSDYIFPSLKAAEEEARAVADFLQSKCLIGKAASLSVIKARSGDADLLYFATHAVFDMEKMLQGSFIAFSPDEKDTTGLWMASDIQRSYLRAKLAVLSACQTGIGKIYDAGFISIGQSFFMAGVAHTVSSLWSIDDQSTKKLMMNFMKEIVKPDYFYPASQLRKAILKYRKTDNNLSHWAPFSVYGFTY